MPHSAAPPTPQDRREGLRCAARRIAAEFLGAFFLVFAGTGAVVVNDVTGGVITHAGVAVTFGLVVMTLIYALGDVSGAHLNPAVTLGFTVAGRFPVRRAPGYIAAQVIGALGASLTLALMFPESTTLGATIPVGAAWRSLVLEGIMTCALMLVILLVATGAKERGLTAGAAIGALVGLEAMFAGPISGASMNPARSLGPALVTGELSHLWIYLVGPCAGACAAIPLHRLLADRDPPGVVELAETASPG